MAREALTDAAVIAKMHSFVPVLMNLDVEREWALRHNVTLHPCMLFTDAEAGVWGSTLEMETDPRVLVRRMQDALDVMDEFRDE